MLSLLLIHDADQYRPERSGYKRQIIIMIIFFLSCSIKQQLKNEWEEIYTNAIKIAISDDAVHNTHTSPID